MNGSSCKYTYRRWMVLLLMMAWCSLWGPAVARAQNSVAYDSSAVAVRQPPDSVLQRYRTDPAYQYDASPAPAWGQRFWQWLAETVFGPLDAVNTGPVLQWGLYLLLAGAMIFAVLRLLRMEVRGAFYAERGRRTETRPADVDDIEQVDVEQRIQEAIRAGDFRRAVRLFYLRALQELAARDLIDWTPDKTNQRYVRELRRPELRPPFARLTALFERVWYGEGTLDAARFERVQAAFHRFEKQLTDEAA